MPVFEYYSSSTLDKILADLLLSFVSLAGFYAHPSYHSSRDHHYRCKFCSEFVVVLCKMTLNLQVIHNFMLTRQAQQILVGLYYLVRVKFDYAWETLPCGQFGLSHLFAKKVQLVIRTPEFALSSLPFLSFHPPFPLSSLPPSLSPSLPPSLPFPLGNEG